MSRRVPRDKRRYLLKDSDRSGFTYFRRELVKDGASLVHPIEKDEPAPHPRFIGGEGEINRGETRVGRKDYPTQKAEDWADSL